MIGEYYGRAYRKPVANSVYRVCKADNGFCIRCTLDNGETWHSSTTPGLSGVAEHQPEAQGRLDVYAAAHKWEPVEDDEPCQTNTPAQTAAASPTMTTIFDYSGLDVQTVDTLHLAERMIRDARKDFILKTADAVAVAHESLCCTGVRNSDTGRFENGKKTFVRWCASVGISKSTAYQLLQVSSLFNDSTPVEQQVLEQASPSLLYAAAKPSAPPELVQAVKDGDITTHKQYQELLAENKRLAELADDLTAAKVDAVQRAETAEKNLDVARDAESKYSRLANEASARAQKAEKRASEAEKERDGARQALSAAKLRGDKYKEQCEALRAETPAIEAKVVDADEVERLAKEKAQAIALERAGQDARDAYDALLLAGRQLDAIWQTLAPRLPQLDPAQRVGAIKGLCKKLEDFEGALQCRL